jgi:hypothetical protein
LTISPAALSALPALATYRGVRHAGLELLDERALADACSGIPIGLLRGRAIELTRKTSRSSHLWPQ